MKNSFKVMSIAGIDIYINWTWLLAIAFITWFLGDFYRSQFPGWGSGTAYVVGFISGILLFGTVLLHELAHSITARAKGLPVHTIVLFIFGGVSNLTQEPQSPGIEFQVAIAGPITSLVLSGIFYLLHATLTGLPTQVTATFGYLASVNLILGLFNLVPGFPLDGGRVLRSILWGITGSMARATRIASRIGEGIGFIFIILGALWAFQGGDIFNGLWIAFIGWYLYNAASSSYQMAMVDRVLVGVDVRDVMDPAPRPVGAALSVHDLIYEHMLSANQRAIPVIGPDGSLAGLVTFGDVNHVPRDEWDRTAVSRIMTRAEQLKTVRPDEHLRQALQFLAENNYHQLPVVENGRLVGMLNRAHVLQYLHMRERLADQGRLPEPDQPAA
jgi:Zn-dependent protease